VQSHPLNSPVVVPLRLDPEQRFSCSQCGRCCRRWEILVSQAEVESFHRRGVDRWFREDADAAEGAARDPFEPAPGVGGFYRIRKRRDGACGFLSAANRCRLHEELGGGRKPLTCRLFPYRFHPTPDAVVVTTSFGCPTVVANQGEPIAARATLDEIKALRTEWFAGNRQDAQPREYVRGRSIDADSLRSLRESLLQILDRAEANGARNLRLNMLRMARALEDLSRQRVIRLPDEGFAEYLALTTRFAASSTQTVEPRAPTRVGRVLQHGFLYVVAAMRLRIEHRKASRVWLRLAVLRLLAHFHRLAPGFNRVDVRVLGRERLDVNAPAIQPVVHHYLRASIEALGAGERPVLDDFAIAVSYLNAARALAVMNAHASGRPVDRATFSEALMEAVDLSHSDDRGLLGRSLQLFAGGVEALYVFGRT
jgi:Fe-S-cluster containining protein